MNKIGIIYHPMIEPAGKLARELEQYLLAKKLAVWVGSAWDTDAVKKQLTGTDLLLTVGGDGTILRAAQAVVPGKTPITGINLGKLGFLTDLSVEEARGKIDSILEGNGYIDERSLLEGKIQFSPRESSVNFVVLNDVVIARGAIARVISVETKMNDVPLSTYRGDGVIVATATGSTGYALAAGGPILPPQSHEIVLVPILPHLSVNYSLVLPPEAKLRLEVQSVHTATISLDGHTNLPAAAGTVIDIQKSRHTLRFLRMRPEAYFYTTLESRLKGK